MRVRIGVRALGLFMDQADSPPSASITRIAVEEFAGQCRRHLLPLNPQVSWFQAMSLDEEQQRQFVRDPVDSLPTALLERLPPLRLILVPYLEKGRHGSPGLVTFEKPAASRGLRRTLFDVREEIFLLFGIEQQDVADYHYELFNAVAGLGAGTVREDEFTRFSAQVLDELNRRARGEVDERSLQWKMKLERRQRLPGHNTKLMHGYARQALEDTLTLYLHGLCCDIDVDAGPRQLGSRYLRRRLELLAEIFPPNPGYNVFPQETKTPAENSDQLPS